MSLCYTNLGDFKNATIYASRVLLIEPHNVKALYRYANGMMNLGEKVKAFEIIKICVEVQKKSRAD
jgi:tetratricopeptide (TPR) repeat protein